MKKERVIGIVGIGIFICLLLQAISFLFFKIIENTLLFAEITSLLIYGISKYLSLLFTLLLFVLIIKKLKTFDYEDNRLLKKVFIYSILGYVATQILEFGLPFIVGIFETVKYMSSLKSYYSAMEDNSLFLQLAVDIPISFLKYILIALIVIKEINTSLKEQV